MWEPNLALTFPVSLCLAVSHHVCEQAPEQAESGGDGTRDPGEPRSGPKDPLSGVVFSQLSDPQLGPVNRADSIVFIKQRLSIMQSK